MTITVAADKFKIAHRFTSKEKTRYYLHGVHIEPHPHGGVYMVATDGTTMMVVYDEMGFASRSAIVNPPAWMLKECKSGNVLAVDDSGTAELNGASAPHTTIDGTFPDWRRVVPTMGDMKPGVVLAAANLEKMTATAKAVCPHKLATLAVFGNGPIDPQFVRFGRCDWAFGVTTPVNAVKSNTRLELPGFFERGAGQ